MTITLVQKQLLSCLRAYAQGTMAAAEPEMTGEDWQSLWDLATAQKMKPIVYETLRQDPAFLGGDRAQLALHRQEIMMEAIAQAARSQRIVELCGGLERQGIPCALVKGIICRELYTRPDLRPSGDEDLFVSLRDRERCGAWFRTCGLRESAKDETVSCWEDSGSGLHIELHTVLLENETPELNARFEAQLRETVSAEVSGGHVRTLAPSWHFAFLVSHALKHFVTGGVGIRTICDIVKFSERYREQLDHTLLEALLQQLHGRIFLDQVLGIGEQWLGISAADCGWNYSVTPEPEEMLLDCLEAGIYGQSSMSRKHSAGLAVQATEKKGGAGALLSVLFPPMESMRRKEPVLERWPVLLPVCWVRRLARYGGEVLHSGSADNSPLKSLSMGKKRTEMMKKYGILEESNQKD